MLWLSLHTWIRPDGIMNGKHDNLDEGTDNGNNAIVPKVPRLAYVIILCLFAGLAADLGATRFGAPRWVGIIGSMFSYVGFSLMAIPVLGILWVIWTDRVDSWQLLRQLLRIPWPRVREDDAVRIARAEARARGFEGGFFRVHPRLRKWVVWLDVELPDGPAAEIDNQTGKVLKWTERSRQSPGNAWRRVIVWLIR